QAMLDYVVEQCERAGVPRARLVVVHADLGRVEWPGTRELAAEQARHYGLAFVTVQRRQGDLLDHIAPRGRFPSPRAALCPSERLCGAPHNRSMLKRPRPPSCPPCSSPSPGTPACPPTRRPANLPGRPRLHPSPRRTCSRCPASSPPSTTP